MQASGGSAFTKVRDLSKGHPRLTAVVTGLLGLLVGWASASSDNSDIEASLASAKASAQDVRDSSEAELSSIASNLDTAEAEIDSLTTENLDLKRQIKRLNAKRELPNLAGDTYDFARSLESKYGWDLRVTYRYSTDRPGTILSQEPASGTMMRYGATFSVVAAKQIPKVPSLVGLNRGAAVKQAEADGYTVTIVEQISSRKPGTVIAMSPSAGSRLIPGQVLTLTVAKKAPPVPDTSSVSSDTGGAGCTPGYSPCLPPASDYDCSGGSGDGPKYTGYVTVTGSDPYGLDSDGDGAGCES